MSIHNIHFHGELEKNQNAVVEKKRSLSYGMVKYFKIAIY